MPFFRSRKTSNQRDGGKDDYTSPRAFGTASARNHLPDNVVPMMERFGRAEFDSNYDDDPLSIWPECQVPLQEFARTDPAGFLQNLAEAVLPTGGWAAYGASHTVFNIVNPPDRAGAAFEAIMDAAIDFLRRNRVPPFRITGHERDYWIAAGGSMADWIPTRPVPTLEEAPISPLGIGESRRLAQLTAAADSNLLFLRHADAGGYVVVIDSKWSNDDPRRGQNDWMTADTLYELYVQVGRSMGETPFEYDSELEPYFPSLPSLL